MIDRMGWDAAEWMDILEMVLFPWVPVYACRASEQARRVFFPVSSWAEGFWCKLTDE